MFNRKIKLFASSVLLSTISFCATAAAPAVDTSGIQLMSDGSLTVLYRNDDKPYSFLDLDRGAPSGFDVQLVEAIADKLGLTPKFIAVKFVSMIPRVRNNRADIAGFDALITSERKQQVSFTLPVNFRTARMLSLTKEPLNKIGDAGKAVIAITKGSALIPILKSEVPSVKLRKFPNVAASTNALLAGIVDGLFTGSAKAKELEHEHHEFLLSADSLVSGAAAFPVSKDRPKLLRAINDALKLVITDGTYEKLFHKWFDAAIPEPMLEQFPELQK